MLSPRQLQLVKVVGREEVFVVAEVYPSLEVVDLAPLGRDQISERAILFDQLEAVGDDTEAV